MYFSLSSTTRLLPYVQSSFVGTKSRSKIGSLVSARSRVSAHVLDLVSQLRVLRSDSYFLRRVTKFTEFHRRLRKVKLEKQEKKEEDEEEVGRRRADERWGIIGRRKEESPNEDIETRRRKRKGERKGEIMRRMKSVPTQRK